MRIIKVNLVETKNFIRCCDNIKKDCILVGKCYDNYYLSELIFQPFFINQNEVITRAVLKMYCKNVCGTYGPLNICINNDRVKLDVYDKGDYEWDVTEILDVGYECNLRLCVYTKDCINGCRLKEFETLDCKTSPILELIVDEWGPNTHRKIIDFVKKYNSTELLSYSDWVDTSFLSNYYYFVKNLGSSDVEVSVEISPNKNLTFKDSGPFIVKANEVSYVQPMRASMFVRISYKNLFLNNVNLISVWLQGKT
jgi:hypothetical protein